RHGAAWALSLLALGSMSWGSLGLGRLEVLPCLRAAPALDGARSVRVHFTSEEGAQGWSPRWLEDLRSKLRGKSLVPPDSDLGQQPRKCYAWSVEGRAIRTADLAPATRFRIWRRGQEADSIQVPGAPAEWQHSWLRRLEQVLNGELPTAMQKVSSRSDEANRKAVNAYGRGDLGRAADILRGAVAEAPGQVLLRNNLAQVLFDMALQERRRAGLRAREEAEIKLLHEALSHLDRALDLEPENPVFSFHRGRVRQRLVVLSGDDPSGAEADFRAALEASPGFPEPANDLAALLLDRDTEPGVREASALLEHALLLADPAQDSTRATILKNLGRAYRAAGRLDDAGRAFEEAECLAPLPRRDLRAEILGRSAQLHLELLGPASADVTWWRYSRLFLADEDKDRRRAFYQWRARHLDLSSRGYFELWSLRCDRGNFASLASRSRWSDP
ncbi:MAG: hypothetical protein MI919_40955, partial [Holophagales bacterium]|nr:hypothetical protein [Holophagales bacterium]